MDFFTGFILLIVSLMMLACFLANIPSFIIHSMLGKEQQQAMLELQRSNQEQFIAYQTLTMSAITTISEQHSEQQQEIVKYMFMEMRHLSAKIPSVNTPPPSHRSRQTTDSMKKLPPPAPRHLNTDPIDDQEKGDDLSSPFSEADG